MEIHRPLVTKNHTPPLGSFVLRTLFVCACLVLPITTKTVQASMPDCETLAEQAAHARGIPPKILSAIARVESGKKQGKLGRRAWPWTLNQAGKGMYFDDYSSAMGYLTKAVKRGVKNIDVGCMQVNYRWHGHKFNSLTDMMDPKKNTQYAAEFLVNLKARLGSWDKAIQHYHSPQPARGQKYLGYVKRVLKKKETRNLPDAPFGSTQVAAVPTKANNVTLKEERGASHKHMQNKALIAVKSDSREFIPPSAHLEGLPSAAPLDFPESLPVKLTAKAQSPRFLRRNWRHIEKIRAEFKNSPIQIISP